MEAAVKHPPGLERLRGMALAYVTWARQNPAFHQVIRNPDVMRHASEDLKQLLSDFADRQRREISTARKNGWRSHEDPDVIFVHLVSLTAGTAIVAADHIYEAPMGASISSRTLGASIDLFLTDGPCP